GDGSVEAIAGNPAAVTHTYADGPASYSISATATDEDGTFEAGNTVAVSVLNVAPTLALSGAGSVDEGSAYTLGLSASDPGADALRGRAISGGDGSVDSLAGTATAAEHADAADGSYAVSATAADEDGSYEAANTVGVAVGSAALTLGLSGAGSVDEGGAYTL